MWFDIASAAAAGRSETGDPLRPNALEPEFHAVPAGPAHRTVVLMVPA
jgi:hypothetical protein